MDHTIMLIDVPKLHCAGWHLARITGLASLILGVFKVKTVNLTEIATTFPGHAELESHYRRLQRFFQHVECNSTLIA